MKEELKVLFNEDYIENIANKKTELLQRFTDDNDKSNGKKLNEKLRNNIEIKQNTDDGKIKNTVLTMINNCKINKTATLFRGLNFSVQVLKDIGILKMSGEINFNKKINLSYFNSMSLSYNASLNYALSGNNKSIMLKITVPKNTNCFPIMSYSAKPSDKEIVFWNITLIIDGVVQDDNVDYHLLCHLI